MGKIYMIMGKSASGKDHIYHRLLEDKTLMLSPLIIYTTRPMRAGEENGREYFFTDEEHLKELRASGKVIEERVYPTVRGNWYYFTVDDAQIKPDKNYLMIGTVDTFVKMEKYLGKEALIPLYIESDPYLRLQRSLKRESKQEKPEYKEVCRRFLADEEDFSEERLRSAGIDKKFYNDTDLDDAVKEVRKYIIKIITGADAPGEQ